MDDRKFACDFYSTWAHGTALYVKWAAHHKISYPELSVLYALLTKGPSTQTAVCAFYGLPKQTVNHCVRSFEQKAGTSGKKGVSSLLRPAQAVQHL